MNSQSQTQGLLDKTDRPILALSLAILLLYFFFTAIFIWFTPYPGFAFTATVDGWRVNDSTQLILEVDQVLVQIDDLTYQQYLENIGRVPFDGYEPGDMVPNVITSDGQTIELQMPEPRLDDMLRRLVATLWFFPFWLAGTAVLLFLRPRDLRWKLLIAFLYLIALWIVVGSIANWQVAYSLSISIILGWLLVPVVLHLHLVVPSPIGEKFVSRIAPILYLGAAIMAIVNINQAHSLFNLSIVALGAAIVISIVLLIIRSVQKNTSVSNRNSSRLMLVGIGLAFGPAILLVIIPQLFGIVLPNTFGLSVAFIALPVLPISYTYAIYKRQLGQLEFRANRLLGLYSFILIFPSLFIMLLLFGDQWIVTSGSRTFYILLISIIFVLATPPLLRRFQQGLNRLAYGTVHDPDDILRVFAKQIPTALTREALIRPLVKDIMPALLIRQSALCLYEGDGLEVVYTQRVPKNEIPKTARHLDLLLKSPAVYLPPDDTKTGLVDWVRLSIPLITREETIGAWLFGRRDPDDFYPQNDIDLLQTLANQLAPVVENISLYEALQQHADSLAIEVANRTAELKSEKDRTQAVLDSAGEGIFFTDPAGVILYANRAMALQSGYDAEELRGKTLDLWQSEDDSPEIYREMWTAIFAGEEWTGEMLLQQKDGKYTDVNLAIAPIQSEDGDLTGFVGVQSDISKLKEIDRVKSNIISSVSHELKTPLTTIKTYLMLIKRGKEEKRDGYLTVLNRETDRLTNIIQDLLDLSKLDAGKIPSKLAPIDLDIAANEVIISCSTRAIAKEISLELDSDPQLPPAFADRNQLEQVLTNLVVNALNYTPPGGNVVVTTGRGQMNGHMAVWCRISDDGPGVDPIDLPHLFDRFYRGQAALESGEPGTGLGLAICKEIIERHNGKLDVSSQPGEGAAFTVWLPADNSRLVNQAEGGQAEPAPASD
jgi:PAS domain S-box-containing protein